MILLILAGRKLVLLQVMVFWRQFKVNGIGIKVVESAQYLGDLFNIKGDNSDTCRERHLNAKGTSVELCSLSRGLSFGIRQIESMLILYKTVFVPRLIYNCEAWSNLTAVSTAEIHEEDFRGPQVNTYCCSLP